MRIILGDDHAIIREGVKKVLRNEPDITVVGEAANAHELIALVQNTDCDLLVLDVNMPGRSGLDALIDIKHMKPELRVLVLSINPEDVMAVRALKAGASGYISKDSSPEELVDAIRRVASGRRYVSTDFAERLADYIAGNASPSPHDNLSQREFEVMLMICRGKTISEIGDALHLSTSTINTYRARILEKMNMQSNAELINFAIHNKLV